MNSSAYGRPILIQGNQATHLKRHDGFNEAFVQDLIFKNVDCLPISEIDNAFTPLIPVCTELNTGVGPLDVFMVTPTGRIAVVETKLWRNPDARRKVIAQILDYAKELAKWNYEDLQREINRRLGTSGNILYKIASGVSTEFELEESAFVDSVSRNLNRGKFLLMLVGDGIREGAEGIVDFLSTAGHLEFSFAMVELAVFSHPGTGMIVISRVTAKTVELHRVIVEIPEGLTLRESGDQAQGAEGNHALSEERQFYYDFWNEFISEMDLDDPGQPLPEPTKSQNIFLYLPGKHAWISAYFMKSSKRVGVYFRCSNTQLGREIAKTLEADREEIISELGENIIWTMAEEGGGAGVRLPCNDIFDRENREQLKKYFAKWINQFVNVFRPRLKEYRD